MPGEIPASPLKSLDGGRRMVAHASFRPLPGLAGLASALAHQLEQLQDDEPEGYTLEKIVVNRDNPSKRPGTRFHLSVYWHRTTERR